MKLTSFVVPLLAAWLAALPAPASAAVSFPIQYTGSYRLTVTVRNQFGSGLCSNTAALTITLQADGQLEWRIAELDVRLENPSNAPASCTILLSGETTVIAGTHDRVSRYSVPSGSPSYPPITGSFDEESIRGQYTAGPSYIEFDLPAVSHRITIEPDPTQGFAFHRSILEGRGFKIVMRDPHGREHLDFTSLKLIVGSTDTTQHLLSRLMQGTVPFFEDAGDSRTRVIRIVPDPGKLMQGHDVFAIPFNGDWRIELRLCDKAQTCFATVYDKVWFGPFVDIPTPANVGDLRCGSPPADVLKLTSVTIGNIGVDAPHAAIYLGLVDAVSGSLWTFYFDDFGDGTGRHAWWQGQVQPLIPQVAIPSGLLMPNPELLVVDNIAVPTGSGAPALRRVPFPAGAFRVAAAALDKDSGALRVAQQNVQMCGR